VPFVPSHNAQAIGIAESKPDHMTITPAGIAPDTLLIL
jgi:hypothetical protein